MATLHTRLPARWQHLPAAAVVAAVTALLVLLPVELGEPGRWTAVALIQLALVLAWTPATGIPGGPGVLVLGVAAAAGADLAVLLPDRPALGWLLAVPGLGFIGAVLHQMLRRAPREQVVGSLAGELLLVGAVTALAVLLRLQPTGDGARPAMTALLVIGTTLVVGHLVDLLLPWPAIAPGLPRGLLGLVVAVPAGGSVALFQHGAGELVEVLSVLTFGLLLAGVAALVGLAAAYMSAQPRGDRVSTQPRGDRVSAQPRGGAGAAVLPTAVLQAALPIAAGAPVALGLVLQQAL